MSFFAAQATSDLVGRFVQDIQEIQRGMVTLFSKFIREPLRSLFLLAAALWSDWRITMLVVMAAPLALSVFWFVGRKVKKHNRRLLQGYGMMIGALTTSLQSIRVVKAYTAEGVEREQLKRVDLSMFRQQLRLARLQALTSPMMETVAIIAASFGTLWLASRVLTEQLDLSEFLSLGVLLSMLFDPLRKLSDVYVRLMRATAGDIQRDRRDARSLDGPGAGNAGTAAAGDPLRGRFVYLSRRGRAGLGGGRPGDREG